RDHPCLHTFPTRRSSDLDQPPAGGVPDAGVPPGGAPDFFRPRDIRGPGALGRTLLDPRPGRLGRREKRTRSPRSPRERLRGPRVALLVRVAPRAGAALLPRRAPRSAGGLPLRRAGREGTGFLQPDPLRHPGPTG